MERKKNVIYLVVITALSVAAFVYLFVKVGKIGVGEYKTYYIVFDNTKGLAEKSDVRLGGLKVGYVDKMRILLDKKDIKIEAEIKVKNDVPIRKDFEAQIRMKSLLGEKYVELIPTGEGDLEEAPEGFRITRAKTLFEPDELILSLKPFIDALDPNVVKEMTGTITDLVRTTEPLIKNTADMVKNLNEITPELKAITKELYEYSDEIAKLIDVFSKNSESISIALSELPKLINNVNSLISNVSGTLKDGNMFISTMVNYQDSITYTTVLLPEVLEGVIKISNFANNMLPEFQKLVTQTSITLEKLQQVLEKGVKVRVF